MHFSNHQLHRAYHTHTSQSMTVDMTYKPPLAVVLLITATLLAVVGRHAASAQGDSQGGELQACLFNCRLRVISCTSGCRIGAGPFPFGIRICLGQCSLRNLQCLSNCISPRPNNPQSPPQRPPRRPILPPIFHRPPRRPRRPIFPRRPPGSPRRPILPPIFHRPPRSQRPPRSPSPIEPHPIPAPPQSLISRPKPPALTTTVPDPLLSSSEFNMPLPQPTEQVDHLGEGN